MFTPKEQLLPKFKTTTLSTRRVTIPKDFLGMHIARYPLNSINRVEKTATGTSGAFTFTITNTANISVGDCVIGTGIAVGSIVTDITGTTITVDKALTTNITSGTVSFYGTVYSQGANSPSGSMMNWSYFRNWDSKMGIWKDHNPAPGVYSWGVADQVYNDMVANGKKILFTIAGTPIFASARPTETWIYGSTVGINTGGAAEAANLQYLWDYCVAVATRYPLITEYEWNNEPNYSVQSTAFFSGTQAKSAECLRVVNLALKSVNPNIKVMSNLASNIDTAMVTKRVISRIRVVSGIATVYSKGHGQSTSNIVDIVTTDFKQLNVVVTVVDADTLTFTTTEPDCLCFSGIMYTNIVGGGGFYKASAAGFTTPATSYSVANSGTGTTALDWMDIISIHTYQNDIKSSGHTLFRTTEVFREYLDVLGAGNLPLWTTEFGDTALTSRTLAVQVARTTGYIFAAACAGYEKVFTYQYDNINMGWVGVTEVENAVANLQKALGGKTVTMVTESERYGSMTAYFTDGTSYTINM